MMIWMMIKENSFFLFILIAAFFPATLSLAQTKSTFKDTRDNKIYKTVTIGSQTWFAENLVFKTPDRTTPAPTSYTVSYNKTVSGEAGKSTYTKYFFDVFKNGSQVNTVYIQIKGSLNRSGLNIIYTSFNISCSWNGLNGITVFDKYKKAKMYKELGSYPDIEKAGAALIQFYFEKKEESYLSIKTYYANSNDKTKIKTYGYLYTWEAANCGCPEGWHLSTDKDWETVINFLGGAGIAGAKLKESGSAHWQTSNENSTNESGFTALPGGYRDEDNPYSISFLNTGEKGKWWTADSLNEFNSWSYIINNTSGAVFREATGKGFYLSVRCVKNQ